MVSNIVSIPL